MDTAYTFMIAIFVVFFTIARGNCDLIYLPTNLEQLRDFISTAALTALRNVIFAMVQAGKTCPYMLHGELLWVPIEAAPRSTKLTSLCFPFLVWGKNQSCLIPAIVSIWVGALI